MPCRPGHGAGAGEVTARGKGVPALAALAARTAQVRHGRGGTLGRPQAGLAWGIGLWGRCEVDGEAMAREVDGGTLTKHAAHRRQWRRPGRRRGGVDGSLLRGVG
jgi:hypothetical protein